VRNGVYNGTQRTGLRAAANPERQAGSVMKNNADWTKRVAEVFDTNPRNGNRPSTVWFRQSTIEDALNQSLHTPGVHLCLDGSSGTGKTSLVVTTLIRAGVDYTTVQVTRKMDWAHFCKLLVKKPRHAEREIKASAIAEWKSVFPTGKLELGVGRKTNELADLQMWEKLVSNATEHDLCESLAIQNCVLLVDEFERASPDLVNRVAEMCKILTQSHASRYAKIITVGADNVYRRLFDCYATLDGRLRQISLGSLPGKKYAWRYFTLGFNKLNLYYPGNSKFGTEEDTRRCVDAVYFAAGGLFKSLTELAQRIVLPISGARGISANSIFSACRAYQDENFRQYRDRFSLIYECARKNRAIVGLIQFLNDRGIGQIHNVNELEDELVKAYGIGLASEAIRMMIEHDFLVLTGQKNERLFLKNPTFGQCLRVYLSKPEHMERLKAVAPKDFQQVLPLRINWEEIDSRENKGADFA
jgi:hypothetical protein